MKSSSLVMLIGGVSLLSVNAMATSVDFRHEYKSDTKQHASRVKMAHTFENNFSMALELKFKGEEGKFMEDLQSNGSEIDLGYRYKINDQWALIPGMPIEFGTSGTTYKPQLRLTYTPEKVKGLSVSGRYRLDVKPGEDVKKYRHRYTANIGYKYQQWAFGLESNYYYADNSDYLLYNNDRTNYENNFTIHYSIGDWTPWLEFGDVSVSDQSSQRELRSRIGLRYNF
ncbi:oligogalacturonate-specific porin KdgM family protein [Agarivorans sp. Toyoura001]|uniref:oligogalacturonate-specific porin KdgM family protein n=1 Tax=Agarivorans sp. Toyoura001 TaxID=2283141 RepID=UPI0010F57220|nr:oligogalacturonate-specific porin KdgM family protein [Agarivorans sp. Toyoura001]